MKSEFKSTCCTSANYLYCVMCEKRNTCKTALVVPKISNKFVHELELTHIHIWSQKMNMSHLAKRIYMIEL